MRTSVTDLRVRCCWLAMLCIAPTAACRGVHRSHPHHRRLGSGRDHGFVAARDFARQGHRRHRSRFRSTRFAACSWTRAVRTDAGSAQRQERRLRHGARTAASRSIASKIDRELVREDIEFYLAYCAAQQALGGKGEVTDAGRKLNEFVRQHPQNFHYLEAVETMGDLLMASDKFAAAQRQYAELAKAPWPDYKMRAGVLLGRTLQAQGKHQEAIREFDTVLATHDDDATPPRSRSSRPSLGKAVSLSKPISSIRRST